jgi:hypothetical protein
LHLGLSNQRQTLSNARRAQLRQYRSSQAAALEAQIPTYDDFHTRLLRDDNRLAGCYSFQSRFTDTTICTETLIMDDTSCTNRHGFPILVILGINEHKLSPLVAFALIRNQRKKGNKRKGLTGGGEQLAIRTGHSREAAIEEAVMACVIGKP